LPKLAAKILITVLIGGFLGATLVRLAPGFGVNEEELDIRDGFAAGETADMRRDDSIGTAVHA